MNLWIKRILGVLPIIGCGAGITVIAVAWGTTPMTATNIASFSVFGLVYFAGAIAGLMLLEGHRHAVTANFFYWLLQTVHLYSFVFSFVFWTPLNLGGWWNISTSSIGLTAQVGSTFQFAVFNENADFALELDVLAVACCIYLFMQYRRERRVLVADSEPAPVAMPQTA